MVLNIYYPLEKLVDWSDDHVFDLIFFKLEDELAVMITTIRQHPFYLDIFYKALCLVIEVDNTVGRTCIA